MGSIGQGAGQQEHVGQAQMEGDTRKRDLARQTHEWEKTHVVDGERQDASPPAAWLGIWEGSKWIPQCERVRFCQFCLMSPETVAVEKQPVEEALEQPLFR